MSLRWLLGRAVRSAAKAKAAESVDRAAVSSSRRAVSTRDRVEEGPCRAAVLFGLPVECETFVARLSGVVTTHAAGLDISVGGLVGTRIAAAVCPDPPELPRVLVRSVVAGHRPKLIVAAGQAVGLVPAVSKGDIVIASSVMSDSGGCLEIGMTGPKDERVHLDRLVTVAEIPDAPSEKRSLGEQFQAAAADRASFSLCDACRCEGVPFMSVRVVTSAVDDEVPRDVQHMLSQRTIVGKVGAFAGSLWRRPKSVQDIWRLKEGGFESSDRLAAFLETLLT